MPTPYCRAFFDLQLAFAERVAALNGIALEQALLLYTNLYIRLGLARDFDAAHPIWQGYIAGLRQADDAGAWTYRYLDQHAPEIRPPSMLASSGCFSYALDGAQTLRMHFRNTDPLEFAPLSAARLACRREELRALFRQAHRELPFATRVVGVSWLYNLEAYGRCYPPAYAASAHRVPPRYANMPLWGQFLDRRGNLREQPTQVFLQRLAQTERFDDLAGCFPLQALAVEAPIEVFYAFYEV
jgi:hypothetical protein